MEEGQQEQEEQEGQEEQEQEQEQELNDCLVCLQPCEELSVDLFLYTCSCVYPVHDTCFKQWRNTTKNDRVCMICREELEYNTEDEEPTVHVRRQFTDERLRSLEETMEQEAQGCMSRCRRTIKKIIWFVCLTILISILLELVRGRRTRSTPSSPPQASSS